VEITNQRFSMKSQTFWQLAAAYIIITDEGSSKLPKHLVTSGNHQPKKTLIMLYYCNALNNWFRDFNNFPVCGGL